MSAFPQKRTTADEVADFVRNKIISGEYEPEKRIQQDVLAKELGISRIPVREGLARLISEGFIDTKAHHSPTVSRLTLKDGKEIFELRAVLEDKLFRDAMTKNTIESEEKAAKMLSDFKQLDSFNDREWSLLNKKFHDAMYESSDLHRTKNMLDAIYGHAERYILKQMKINERSTRAFDQHAELLNLFIAKKVDDASRLLKDHILNILADLERLGLPEK